MGYKLFIVDFFFGRAGAGCWWGGVGGGANLFIVHFLGDVQIIYC